MPGEPFGSPGIIAFCGVTIHFNANNVNMHF